MKNDPNCRFCRDGIPANIGTTDAFWDRPLVETENFFVVPSLGALVEGWLLIVTKEHHICMGSLEQERMNELKILLDIIKNWIRSIYGSAAAFEHGPVSFKQPVGCGVDHAHIHVVPTSVPLIQNARKWVESEFVWSRVSGIEAVSAANDRGNSYLYVDQDDYAPMLYDGGGIPSQLFRKTIADSIGIAEQYNWREHAHEEVIAKTIVRLEREFHRLSLEGLNRYGGAVIDKELAGIGFGASD